MSSSLDNIIPSTLSAFLGFFSGTFIFSVVFRRLLFSLVIGMFLLAIVIWFYYEWRGFKRIDKEFPYRGYAVIGFMVGFGLATAIFGRAEL